MRAALFAVSVLALASACAPRVRMCTAPGECGAPWACVAGRCQPEARVPAIAQTGVRRLVVSPIDVAYLRRGDAVASTPTVFALGRAADGDAILFMRFSVALPPTTTILEAYLLLDRSDAADADPTPIALHASRIIDPWDARSISWARQPRIDGARAPSTAVTSARDRVRLDIRDLTRHWRLHSPDDQGIAVVAENASPTGMAFALTPPMHGMADERGGGSAASSSATARLGVSTLRTPPPIFSSASDDVAPAPAAPPSGPRLELYVK